MYNSIVVTGDDTSEKALNFTNSNTTDVVNSILGGLEGASSFLSIIDDVAKNNSKTVTATSAGLITTLDDGIGPVAVLPLDSAGTAVDYATAPVSITLPTTDARGVDRGATPDAGAYEIAEISNVVPTLVNPVDDLLLDVGFAAEDLDMTNTFSDVDNDSLRLSVEVADESIVTAAFTSPFNLRINELGLGETTITVTADDGNDGIATSTMNVSVNTSASDDKVFIGNTGYPDITSALTAAVDGDVILVMGVHTEPITINKSVTLRGEDPTVDIIQAAETSGTASDRVVNILQPDDNAVLTVTIENLGIQNGNSTENGGGINADKVTGLLTLRNLIIANNATTKNGGGVNMAGSNADVIDCTLQNNTSTLDGGGVVVAPSNGAGIDNDVRILSSLIDSNMGRNGGGLYINGNNNFGNDHLIDVYIENTTLSNNAATSGSGGSGGGAIWSKGSTWTSDNTTGNASLTLVHTTLYNNTHSGAAKNGIRFTSAPAGSLTNFQLYNSIVVTGDDVGEKALNFTNSNTTDVVNSILGGLEGASSFLTIIDDAAKNNSKGRTATFAGLTSPLNSDFGPVAVLPLDSAGTAVDFCTAAVGVTLPTTDARGIDRDATPDAGAYEIAEIPNIVPVIANPLEDLLIVPGFVSQEVDMTDVFSDPDDDLLTLSAVVANESIVTAAFTDPVTLNITEVGTGQTTITVTANDGNGGIVTDVFEVNVGTNALPVVADAFSDLTLKSGFIIEDVDMTNTFSDADNDSLSFSVQVTDESVVTAAFTSPSNLRVTEVGLGETTITVTADDGNGGSVTDAFEVVVNANSAPVVVNPVSDLMLDPGFAAEDVDMTNTFTDADNDPLILSAEVADESVVTAAFTSPFNLRITEVGSGETTITVTADDGNDGITASTINIIINTSTSDDRVFIGEVGYPSISTALLAAVDGDVILVIGVHNESITVDKSVTLRGEDPTIDIIQAAESPGTASDRVVNVVRPDDNPVLNVTIENLGIQNGNTTENGGGINVDKVTGLLTLRNLIITNNATTNNGGGVSIVGSVANIIDCTIQNNTSTLDGGGIIVAPNNGANVNSELNIFSSLVDSNIGRNGGGLYINGNNNFGNDQFIDVYIENTTLSNNAAISGTSAAGGGAIWSKGSTWTGDNTTGNASLTLVHATLYNNTHSGASKNGIRFTSAPAGSLTNFRLYNSIIVTADDVSEKALNFTNSNTTDVVNSILGGLEGASSFLSIIDDAAKNNSKGRTATFAGLTSTLSNDFGPVAVLPLDSAGTAVDFCTATVGVTLPITDARGLARDATPDAGAYEIADIPNRAPVVVSMLNDEIYETGFGTESIDLSGVFQDADNDMLSYSVNVLNTQIVTAIIQDESVIITEVGLGTTDVEVTANDGNGGGVTDVFKVTVSPNLFPIVANPIGDQILSPGFMMQNVDLTNTFTDADNDPLTLSVEVADESIVTAAFTSPFNLTITEVGLGETTVTVTADDGNGGVVPETFVVSVGGDGVPVVVNPIGDIASNTGFLISTIDISETFGDADNDDLTFSVLLQYDSVVDATVEGDFIIVKESSFGLTECTVTAMDNDGNSVSDMFIINIDFVLSVENEIPDFLFYPNPVTSDFRINAGDVEGTIRILSFEGKVLRQYQYSPTASYEVWDMEKGVYLMQFIQDNKANKTVKFIIR
ncbi:MAG: choice-of-anchor Q domain-containing protein [Fulvivirga sp.]